MRLLCLLVWKNWVSSPLRLALTVLGVALGVAIVASIHVLDHNTILSQLERVRGDYGRVDFELHPMQADMPLEEQRARLSAVEGIDRIGLLGNAQVQIVRQSPLLVSLYGLSPVGERVFGHYRVATGEDLSDLDPEPSVLISPQLASMLQLDVGSSFDVQALPKALESKCVGGERVTDPEATRDDDTRQTRLVVKGILQPFRLARKDAGLVVIGKFSLARRLARVFRPIFQVKREPGVDPDLLEATLRKDWILEQWQSALIGQDADERAFRNGVKVLGCLALILGMFVIFHTLSHSLAERIRRVGILRGLGASQGQVSGVFLIDALLMSIVGAGLGIGGGIWLAQILADQRITTLGLGKQVTTFEIPWAPLLTIATLGVLITMLGAAFPLLKVRTLSPQRILYVRDLAPPADLMRGVNVFLLVLLVIATPLGYLAMTPLLSGEGKGAGVVLVQSVAIVALFFAVLLLSPRLVRWLGAVPLTLVRKRATLAAFLVRKNLLRSPGRVATSVCGLTLVALAMLGMRALTSSLKGEVRDFGAVALDHRVYLKCESSVPEASWQKLREIPGVVSVLPMSAIVVIPFRTLGTDAVELAKPGGALDGQPELLRKMREERGLLISSRLSKLRGLSAGERIPVQTDTGLVHYEILAVTDREGFFPDNRSWALADRKWFHEDFCLEVKSCQRFSLRLAVDADPQGVVAAAGQRVGSLSWSRSGSDVLAFHLNDVDRDFRFFDILLWLLLALAGVGQINLVTLTTIARSREIGVLRALGMTRSGFVQILLVEALVVGFLAATLALVAGLPLSWILVRGLQLVSGLDVPYVMPWKYALFVGGLGFAVALLAALPPALRATGVAPAASVRSTE